MSLSLPTRRASIAWRLIEGEAILVNPDSGLVYPLDPVATRIWELLDGAHAVEAITEVLAEEFEAPRDAILKDVREFLEQCAERGLVQTPQEV